MLLEIKVEASSVLLTQSWKISDVTFALFCWSKLCYRVSPDPRQGSSRALVPRDILIWKPSLETSYHDSPLCSLLLLSGTFIGQISNPPDIFYLFSFIFHIFVFLFCFLGAFLNLVFQANFYFLIPLFFPNHSIFFSLCHEYKILSL